MAVERNNLPRPERPPPERVERLRRLAELHDEFVRRNLDAPFHPEGRREGSDYNQHYADLEAPTSEQDEFLRQAREIMELDPETGLPRSAG
jgi:hypothetical protein